MSDSSKRKIQWRWLFLAAGLILFAILVIRLKPATLLQYVQRVGFNIVWILLLGGVWLCIYSFAWELFLKKINRGIGFWEVFKMKTAGEAINNLTPLSWGGGDPMRILWLKEHIPFAEGAASVVVDRTLNNLAMALFMIIGIAMAFITLPLPPAMQIALIGVLSVIVGVSIFLFVRSHEGLFQFFIDLLKRLRLKKTISEKTQSHVTEIDGIISRFYRSHRSTFLLAFLLHFLGRLCGVLEIYLIGIFLHFPLSFEASYLLASLTVIINLLFVFVPGAMGVMEGAFAGLFALLNLDPAIGTSLQIVRRIRLLVWAAIGFFFMSRFRAKPKIA